MNIFVSYGHKDYPDFVKKFVLDLGENNIVWTDEKIKLGSPWVQEIDDAIRQSDVFLFLLASDAIRKDSYCYGEIIYAKNIKKKIVVLVLENITMPTIIAQWQYFSMENVFDICGNFMVEEYNAMFPKFLLKLEQCLLQTEESLHSNISSLKYFNNMQRLKSLMNECFIDFALLDLTDKWLKSGKTYFALLGGAGSGKSTAATVMYDRYKKKAAIHFCNYANEKTTDTRIILQSIAKGLTDISSEYKDILSTTFNFERDINGLSTDDIFEELFLKPLDILSDSNTYIIILDGIDEISQKQKREFYRILFKRTSELSGKLKIFLTSRKDSEFVTALYANGAEILDKYEHFNHNSIKNYVNKWFSDNSIFYDDICLDNIILQSKGDFLYVKFILEEIKLQKITDITKIIFPIGMKGVCQSYFDRIFYDDYSYYEDKAAPFLEIIISIKTPISIEAIKSILNYDDFDVRQLVKKLDMFLELRDNTIMLIHKSIHDWLCNITLNDKYYISLNRGKKNLCGFIEREFTTYSNMIDEYVEEFGFKHLIEIGRFEKIAEIISKGLNNIHTLFFDFAKQLLLSNETHLLVNLFSIAAKEQYDVTNVSYVVAEVIKLMLQYGKKEVAENIVSCFKAKENYNQLIELLKFYEIKAFNNNTALIIEKGETIVNNKVYDIRILAEIARILGDAYRENGNHVRAVELYSDSKSKANEHKLDSLYLDCECALVDMEYVVGNVDTALCKLMILKSKIDFKTPDIYTYKYYRLLGHIFHIKSAQNDAMNAFSESLNIANALSFSLKQIETYNSLAELQNNFSIAKIYLEEGRKLSAVTGLNSLEFGKSFYIEASLLLKESKYKEALNCVEKAIQILENVGYGSGCARSYLIKGKILFQTEFYNEAVIYLERAGKYYIRECIYPTFRLEVYFFVLKCAEKIDQITKYKNFDVLDYFDINQFPHMKSIFETINLTK